MKSSKKTRFLSAREVDEAIDEIADLAEDDAAQVVLIGGCAMQVYGSSRLTQDVDVAAGSAIEGLKPASDLSFGGYISKTSRGVPVDVVVRDDEYAPLYEAAVAHAVEFDDIALPVVDPNYLAAIKMAAGRDKDQLDLEYLITSGELDEDETKKIVREYLGLYAVDEFDRIAEEAKWKAKSGR